MDTLIGHSGVMERVKDYIARAASTESNVLITGETGTGKELAAELLHRRSARQAKPMISFNCAALPDNLLEGELFGYERGAFTGATSSYPGKLALADGGTVFLDEVGEMTPYAQVKMLRALESREVFRLGAKASVPIDVRIVAATNQDLERLIDERKFRSDFYYRLNVVRVHMPPLRDRKEDLPLLCDHIIRRMSEKLGRPAEGLSTDALASLLRYDWPGNVRELKNLLEAAFVTLSSRQISLADIPEHFRAKLGVDPLKNEKDRILESLLATNWNKSRAAEQLRWSRMTLYRKLAKYRLSELQDTRPQSDAR